MLPRVLLFSLSLVTAGVLAGCLTPASDGGGSGGGNGGEAAEGTLRFSAPVLLDDVRAGGEPVIAILPDGVILVSAHPGYTHTTLPPSDNLAEKNEGQSYIWRSTDGGATWTGVAPVAAGQAGPKGPWAGVSDPDFAVDAEGRVFFTDLGPLSHAAVARSDDSGETWLDANPVASGPGPVDRQWLAAHGTDVWFIANYFSEEKVLKSSDGGLTWEQVGGANCGGDISADPGDGTLYIGCSDASIDVSTDGGATWERKQVAGAPGATERTMAEPAVDASGNVYIVWSTTDGIWIAGSSFKGDAWTEPLKVSEGVEGTHVWPWIVAGDEGRVAVVWLGTPEGGSPGEAEGEWFVYQTTVVGALDVEPEVHTAKATPEPVHVGPVCQNGTVCQMPAGPTTGDRRLGDFFEAAVDADGYVNIAYPTTTMVEDSISHPAFVKQTGGARLRI